MAADRLLAVIDRGSTGTVWRASVVGHKKEVALKVIRSSRNDWKADRAKQMSELITRSGSSLARYVQEI